MLAALSGTFWENIGLMPFHLPSPHCWEVNQGGRPGFGLAKAAALLPSSGKSKAERQRPGHLLRSRGCLQEGLRGQQDHCPYRPA